MQPITVTYLYAERYVVGNKFKMGFSMSPSQSGLTSSSFNNNFNTTIPVKTSTVTFDPDSSIIYYEGEFE